MIDEIWKDIPGYEGHYQASTLGKIRSLDRYLFHPICRRRFLKGRVLKLALSDRGYLHLCLYNPKNKNHRINRLIAQTFIPNPENLPEVNHKDGNKLNNNVDNLEWCTSSENNLHAVRMGLVKRGVTDPRSKPVVQLTLDGDFVAEFAGVKEAARETGISLGNISNVLHKKRNFAGGYKWEFKTNYKLKQAA